MADQASPRAEALRLCMTVKQGGMKMANLRAIALGFIGITCIVSAVAPSANAQNYPTKPVKLVANNAAGGILDSLARIAAGSLTQRLGAAVAVDNKPGAGGIIGAEAVVRSPADGYTLLFSAVDGLGVYPVAVKMPFDTTKDLLAIAKMTEVYSAFAVSSKFPAQSMKEFIALAKAQPGKFSISSSGIGSSTHMNIELLKARAGIDVTHIPYKGSAVVGIPDLISGRIDAMSIGPGVIKSHVVSGTARVLAVTGPTRSALYPEIPTMIENGFPGYIAGSFFGVFAPAGTPQDIVRRLAKELSEIANSEEFVGLTAKIAAQKTVSVLDEFSKDIENQARLWHTLAKERNIKLTE